jgi:CheY-like chemotaxis protein
LISGKEDTDKSNGSLAQSDKIKILAAEDNPINQLLLTAILKQINAEFIIVENGQILLDVYLDVYKDKHFDVILMDLMMPVKDGFQSTIEIRNLEDKMKSEIPIIAVSADVTEMVTIKCKQIGMSGYLSKPFVKNDLVEIIERLIKE